jgi:hopanoid biosynthesis associated RND transporter like protein HpnN
MTLPSLLAALVERCRRAAPLVVLAGLALAVVSGWYAAGHLGVSTDTDQMFAASLPWRQRAMALDREFPQFQNLLVAVIDARAPEEAEATAAALASAMAADTAHVASVRRPDASPYLAREGLLFLDLPQLQALLDHTVDAQPFLGQLVADPSARGLLGTLGLIGVGVQRGEADLGGFAASLASFHTVLSDALAGHPQPLSWQNLLSGPLSKLGGQYKFVLVQPKLDFGSLQPGGAATADLRAAAAKLEFVKSGDARVRITGSVALSDEEFATVAQGTVTALIGSVVLITLWLLLALGTWRLILPALATLALGLLTTVLFAALAVGTLNLISVGFGVLFVGIAVDFAIQFSVRYREMRHEHADTAQAMAETGRRAGVQILIAALATAAGFLAFVPTDFSGVAELGLIAGVGMLIAFACTLTFLPAAIELCRPRAEAAEVGFRWAQKLDVVVARRRRPLLAGFAVIAVAGVALAPGLQFDSDPLHTKNPNTEAMATLRDLLADAVTNPYSVDVLTANAAAAEALAPRLAALPLVARVLSINALVPEDQPPKLAAIADANSILAVTLAPHEAAAPVTASDIRLAAKTAEAQIAPALPKLGHDDPLALIDADLRAVAVAPDATLIALDAALTRFLPMALDRLRVSLSAEPATIATIPPELRRDWLLPDGRARVEAIAKPAARDSAGLHALVRQVAGVTPDAGGAAVTIVATADTIVGAFREAAIGAIVAIAVILLVALRRVLDMALVLAPLLLSALMTVIVIVLLPLPINFANIIALPLLLGVGVSFNIYFVMNWRAGRTRMLGSATARAVMFSALTTGSAFGALALSGHPGTASMGELLLISLACTLVASLLFIPALLSALGAPKITR